MQRTDSILNLLADYRILSTKDLIQLLKHSPQMIRKKLRQFKEKHQIQEIKPSAGALKYYELTQKGHSHLKHPTKYKPFPLPLYTHQLLLNRFRFELTQLLPNLSLDFRTETSLLHPTIQLPTPQSPNSPHFVPDATLIASNGTQKLLHFVEIDCGTESLRSHKHYHQSLLHKLDSYRIHRGLNKSNFLGDDQSFNGYRVLFVTDSQTRYNAICELVTSERWCDFIWVADISDLNQWARGGTTYASLF